MILYMLMINLLPSWWGLYELQQEDVQSIRSFYVQGLQPELEGHCEKISTLVESQKSSRAEVLIFEGHLSKIRVQSRHL